MWVQRLSHSLSGMPHTIIVAVIPANAFSPCKFENELTINVVIQALHTFFGRDVHRLPN